VSERSGVLITLEGCDGCGKSTQAALLCERLAACGLPVGPSSAPGAVIREPGGTAAGEAVRDVLLHGPEALAPWTEALLYAATRAELVERVLLPELGAGRVLVLDRFIDSSLAYQGFARGLGIDAVLAVNEPGLRGLLADLTIVLDVDPLVGLARAGGAPDRIEAEGLDLPRCWPSTSRVCAACCPTSRSSSTSIRSWGWRAPAARPTASRPKASISSSGSPPASPWWRGASRSACV